jgi:hypothetical protein
MRLKLKWNRVVLMRILLVFFCSVAVVFTAAAQTSNVTITGTITDQSGAFVPGATVTATNTQTGIAKSDTSDQAGRYTILSLTPGFYDVQAAQPGFATVVRRNQEFLVGTTVTIDFSLQISSVGQTVEVTGEAPVMETTQSSVSRIVETREMDSLPILSRGFTDLAALTPGVVSTGVNGGIGLGASGAGGISIGNAAQSSTGFLMDGFTVTGTGSGGPYFTTPADWIQEFSVMALQFPAEYGSSSAGVVNTITRSGTNQIHGRIYDFYQNAALNSNPEFYTAPTKAPSDSERIGGMAGGPIKKDKLFYFAGFEYFHSVQTTTVGAAATKGSFAATAQPVGTPAAQLVPWLVYGTATSGPATATSKIAMLKLDYTPNATNSFSLRSNLDYEYSTSNVSGSTTFGYATALTWAPHFGETIGWTRTLSPRSINELHVGYFATNSRSTPYYWEAKGFYTGVTLNPNPYNYVTTASLGGQTPLGNPDGNWAGVSYAGVNTGTSGIAGLITGVTATVLRETLTLDRGKHEVKLGGGVQRNTVFSNQEHSATDGNYTFAGAAGAFNPNAAISQTSFSAAEASAPLSYIVVSSNPISLLSFNYPSWSWGAFIQDSWRMTGNLTVNLGVRYDLGNTNSSLSRASDPVLATVFPGSTGFLKPGVQGINNDAREIQPRLGVAWTPFNDNKRTVVRGGFGVFYDQTETNTPQIFIQGNSDTASYNLAANVLTSNPYCIGNTSCSSTIPAADEIAVMDVLASALANYTLPQFPTSTSPCAATNSCQVTVGSNTYTIPALTLPYNPQGNALTMDRNFKAPGEFEITAGIQRDITNSLNASADFVYRRGFNDVININGNISATGIIGTTTSYGVLNPAYTTFNTITSGAFQVVKDLEMQVHYRDHRGDSMQVAYQFGYSNDDDYGNFQNGGRSALATNPLNLMTDYGPSFNDARNILNVNGAINLLWGIQLTPLAEYTGALPYTATSALQTPGSANAPPGCLSYFSRCYPKGYSRNSLRGDSFFSLNARLSKNIRLGESRSVTLMFEGYDVTNKHNHGTNYNTSVDPSAGFPNGNVGTLNGTGLPLRQLQVGGRFDF